MKSNGAATFHHVAFTEEQRKLLRRWGEHAERAGLLDKYRADIRDMLKSMENHPRAWGNYLGTNTGLDLDIYHGFTEFLVIYYGVHRKHKVVIVQNLLLRSDLNLPDTFSS